MKTLQYLITFRGHGQLTDSKILEVPSGGYVSPLARASADYWCRSHGSPFAYYSVTYRDSQDITGVVSRDVGARYSVIVGNHPAAEYHDFRSKKERDAFADLCREKSISHTVINWVTKPKKASVK